MTPAHPGSFSDQLPSLIENVPAIVFRASGKDESGRLLFVSRNISIYGYEPENFTDGEKSWFSIVHPDDRMLVAQSIRDYSAKGINSFRLQYRLLAQNGDCFPVTEFNVVNRDAQGNILCYDFSIINTDHFEEHHPDKPELQAASESSANNFTNPEEAPQTPPLIKGVSIEAGLASVGGKELSYHNVLATFQASSAKAVTAINEARQQNNLNPLIVHVHALKSSLASIGARDLSGRAAAIEAAGHAGKHDEVLKSIDGFVEELHALLASIKDYLAQVRQNRASLGKGTLELLRSEFEFISAALETFDLENIEGSIKKLQQYTWPEAVFSNIGQLEEKILLFDHAGAQEQIAQFLQHGSAGPGEAF